MDDWQVHFLRQKKSEFLGEDPYICSRLKKRFTANILKRIMSQRNEERKGMKRELDG